jgi:hypothetical protein
MAAGFTGAVAGITGASRKSPPKFAQQTGGARKKTVALVISAETKVELLENLGDDDHHAVEASV